jgi:proline iminopeptidase
MAYINVKGVDHYYEWVRSANASTQKPVMVFLHGWGGSARYWQDTAAALADLFDCLLYDMRGFGRSQQSAVSSAPLSPSRSDYELETYAEDLDKLMAGLELTQPVYLNAHSMGASIAILFLNRYPQRVERAILTCNGIFEYDEKAFSAFHKWGAQVVKFRPAWLKQIPLMHRIFIARFLHRPVAGDMSRAFLEDYLMADYEAAKGTIFTSVSKKATEVMPQEFAQLKVPVLLVAGQYDQIIPAAGALKAAELNELVQYVEIPNTSHFPMLEDFPTYMQRVSEFLGVVPAESKLK